MATPAERSTIARIAAQTRWGLYETDRSAATAAARAKAPSSLEYWYPRVDPHEAMTPDARAKAAESARSAYYQRLARAGRKAKAAKRKARMERVTAALEHITAELEPSPGRSA